MFPVRLEHQLEAAQCFFDFGYVCGVAATNKAFAARAEACAWNDGHAVFFDCFCGELLRRHARRSYVREHVERAFRLVARQAHVDESFVHYIAPLLIAYAHLLNFCPAVAKPFGCGVLAENRWTNRIICVKLAALHEQIVRRGNIADSPACHGKRF